jgi:F5/8 type C domain-containing protein
MSLQTTRRIVSLVLTSILVIGAAGCWDGPPGTSRQSIQSGGLSPKPSSKPLEIPPPVWGGSTTVPLIAGRSTIAGKVTAAIEGDHLVVSYTVKDSWTLSASQLDIQIALEDIPQTPNNKNPIPGKFAYKRTHAPSTTTTTFELPLSWAPGDTLYIAAHADVVDSKGHAEGAWAAGTRFNEHGNWATYFTFTPDVQVVVDHGDQWLLLRVAGRITEGPEAGEPFNRAVYMVQGPVGISASPLPSFIKDQLLEGGVPDSGVFYVSKDVVDALVVWDKTNVMPPLLQKIAEPEDPPLAPLPADGTTSPFASLFSKCGDKGYTKDKTIPLSQSIPLYSGNLGSNTQVSLSVGGAIEGQLTGELNVKLKRTGRHPFCIPYGAEFDNFHAFGNASVSQQATLTGTITYQESWEKELANVELFDFWFSVSYIPVRFVATLPISIGADLTANATAQASYNVSQLASGSFDYVCTEDSCTGSSNYQLNGGGTPSSVTASLSGRVQPALWAEAAIQAYFYSDKFLSAQVGIRPYLHGDLWGYAGTSCGEGSVQGLTFDFDWELTANAQGRALGRTFGRHTVYSSGKQHISFSDLINSSALTPQIKGPSSVSGGTPASFEIGMRPCWPYDDRMAYQVDWGDGSGLSLNDANAKGEVVQKTWNQQGTYSPKVLAISDKHGRVINMSASTGISVNGNGGGGGSGGGGGGGGGVKVPLTVNAVSASCPEYPPSYAVDGDPSTLWGACDWPMQFIEVDLGQMRQVSKIRLLTEQYPAGETLHSIFGRDSSGNWVIYYGDIAGYTTTNQWLELNSSAPTQVRYLFIQTKQGPSWVSWREIEVYATP